MANPEASKSSPCQVHPGLNCREDFSFLVGLLRFLGTPERRSLSFPAKGSSRRASLRRRRALRPRLPFRQPKTESSWRRAACLTLRDRTQGGFRQTRFYASLQPGLLRRRPPESLSRCYHAEFLSPRLSETARRRIEV